ncbi:sensor histidine kinase [Nonomuraea wenchangensis]|uniref:histidine kinase n=1 Tax=Nonomuraea wenchangensis TaxID=568860 RepID=A0A1H9YYP1_9ACTN|nr:ATP-binding protein [Nonomuraea wenchangensis]SES73828.1 Signal transduction histidine kinase [Nonomuraea wenchangensis]
MPIRRRLALTYGSVFFLAAGILVAINYVVVDQIVNQQVLAEGAMIHQVGEVVPQPGPPPGGSRALLASSVNDQIGRYRELVMSWLLRWSLLATAIVGLAGVATGWLIARRALRPLQTVTETARKLSEETLHRRISLGGPHDEVRELADTFDSMLERLDRAFDGQRRFVANVSHELRTPLAINRALLQVSLADDALPRPLRPVRDELLAANGRQERLIEGLLLLAQSEREVTVREPVDLRDLADRPDLPPAPTVGDPVLLERMVANLLDNAAKYNDERGLIEVRTATSADQVAITVENTGPVVPAGQVALLFEPFSRLERDRVGSASGAGLGLSIVRAIVRAHGGTVATVPREDGGLAVTVRLSRAALHGVSVGGGCGEARSARSW